MLHNTHRPLEASIQTARTMGRTTLLHHNKKHIKNISYYLKPIHIHFHIRKKTLLKNLCANYGGGYPESPFDKAIYKDDLITLTDNIDIKQFDNFTLTSEGWDCEVHISQVI